MRLACCRGEKQISIDFDEQDRITTYDGLESCILNSCNYEDDSSTSRADGCATDSLDESDSISSSSKDASGSFSSQWLVSKHDEHGPDEWEEVSKSPQHFYFKQKLEETAQCSDVETMKERFSKLLLGEDVTGGRRGLCTALTLSNAITNLAASIFGELWKLEPLPKDRKCRWRGEMDWLLSPTNYMVELVPARQDGTDGRTLEIMTPKTRSDIHMNLPALQKLDSMLIETLDSMVNTEFWYAEGGSRAEGRSTRQSRRWWLPSPRVPMAGLSVSARKKLVNQGRVVQQVFKAAKTINSNVLLEMPVPTCIRDAIPKSGKANLGEELYSILSMDLSSEEKILAHLDLRSEHIVLQTMNQLETALFAWKQRATDHVQGKSPVRNSWSFVKDPVSEVEKTEILLERAEALLQLLKSRFPNLPQTFLDVTRIQYNKDVGHSILEAYSRVIGNVAFRILSRVKDILQEDDLSNPNSPISTCCFSGINPYRTAEDRETAGKHVKRSLLDRLQNVDKQYCNSNLIKASELDSSDGEPNATSVTITSSRSRVWCISRKACSSLSPRSSP